MRESIGTTFVFTLVLTFTLIFAGFLVLALSYSKAYKIKNEVTSIIEKYEGITLTDNEYNKGSINIINSFLLSSGYSASGSCKEGEYGIQSFNDSTMMVANKEEKYLYCIGVKTSKNTCKTYFTVTIFYDFNLPVFGRLNNYSIVGQTNEVNNAYLNGQKIEC